ncbi:MAG TPA: hypothetical protein VFE10_02610 [Phenylobacterium sp.]|jgi:hypothetical protein|nr:hypothetical protein [Phenylobacterium sp.]
MVKEFATRHGSALRSLAVLVGLLATVAAVVVGAVLAVVFAATVAVIGIMASALLGFAGLALRARRTARADGVIEARHLGGHHWVAYGWNESR